MVFHAYSLDGDGVAAGDAFADGAAETADVVVFFGGDDAAGVGGAFED